MSGIELGIQRRSLGYTQLELANIIGASRATVSRWESSEKPVKYLVVSFMLSLPPKRQETHDLQSQ
jgi:DNA-binding XRE family transcriptional regulator